MSSSIAPALTEMRPLQFPANEWRTCKSGHGSHQLDCRITPGKIHQFASSTHVGSLSSSDRAVKSNAELVCYLGVTGVAWCWQSRLMSAKTEPRHVHCVDPVDMRGRRQPLPYKGVLHQTSRSCGGWCLSSRDLPKPEATGTRQLPCNARSAQGVCGDAWCKLRESADARGL